MNETGAGEAMAHGTAAASWLLSNALFVGLVRRNILSAEDARDILERSLKASGYSGEQARLAGDAALADVFARASEFIQGLATHPQLQG